MNKSIFFIALTTLFLQSCFVSNTSKLRKHKPLLGKIFQSESKTESEDIVIKEDLVSSEIKQETSTEQNYQNTNNTDLATTSNEITLPDNQKKLIRDAGCDKITFLNGNEEEVKLMEIGDDFVKYKKCDNLDGPIYNTSKDKIFMICYSNGTKEVIEHKNDKTKVEENNSSNNNSKPNNSSSEPQVNGLAIVSFILGILGFIPLGGLILGVIANNQISKNPDKYKGKGFAMAGIVLSFVWIMLLFILLT